MIKKQKKSLKPVIIIGAGGHSCTIVDYLIEKGRKIIGFTDKAKFDFSYKNFKVMGIDQIVLNYNIEEIELVMGIGIIPKNDKRLKLIKWFNQKGYKFASVVSPNSFISSSVKLGVGVQIASGTIIQSNVSIGDNCIINTNSSIDHDSWIGNNCHIAPGVTVCGDVYINNNVFVGAGSTIINGINVGKNVIIPAGSLITSDIKDNAQINIKNSVFF
ncbi:acetyltransferase [Alphaproteobacteria bacterium]|nr:acetyltransferase [Alphaproteobacteria bacterium]